MGSYAGLFQEEGAKIPEEKRQEFSERLDKLFQAGGMMRIEQIQLCGKKVYTIRKTQMEEKGIDYIFNYFISSWGQVGWINYLFGEHYHVKNFDPWKLFEARHKYGYEEGYDYCFGEYGHAFIGECETYAVLNGTENAMEEFSGRNNEEMEALILKVMKGLLTTLKEYRTSSGLDEAEQLRQLMKTVRSYYESADDECLTDEKRLELLIAKLELSDAPAFFIKAVSEMYNRDFWELWNEIKDVAERKMSKWYGNDGCYVMPISTADYMRLSPDDLIAYWEKESDLQFSKNHWKI